MMKASEDTRICLGEITGARGLRGEMRLRCYADDPGGLGQYSAFETQTGRELVIEQVNVKGGRLSFRARGVTSREAAEALKGTKLYVPRSALPEPGRDDFYHADLVGLEVKDGDGARIGRVAAVHNFGAGDLLEVLPVGENEKNASFFAPFNREVVPVIDVKGGWLTLLAPPGLLESPKEEAAS